MARRGKLIGFGLAALLNALPVVVVAYFTKGVMRLRRVLPPLGRLIPRTGGLSSTPITGRTAVPVPKKNLPVSDKHDRKNDKTKPDNNDDDVVNGIPMEDAGKDAKDTSKPKLSTEELIDICYKANIDRWTAKGVVPGKPKDWKELVRLLSEDIDSQDAKIKDWSSRVYKDTNISVNNHQKKAENVQSVNERRRQARLRKFNRIKNSDLSILRFLAASGAVSVEEMKKLAGVGVSEKEEKAESDDKDNQDKKDVQENNNEKDGVDRTEDNAQHHEESGGAAAAEDAQDAAQDDISPVNSEDAAKENEVSHGNDEKTGTGETDDFAPSFSDDFEGDLKPGTPVAYSPFPLSGRKTYTIGGRNEDGTYQLMSGPGVQAFPSVDQSDFYIIRPEEDIDFANSLESALKDWSHQFGAYDKAIDKGTFRSDGIEQSRKERQDFMDGAEHQISMLSDGEYKENVERTLIGLKKLDSMLVKLEDKGIRGTEIKNEKGGVDQTEDNAQHHEESGGTAAAEDAQDAAQDDISPVSSEDTAKENEVSHGNDELVISLESTLKEWSRKYGGYEEAIDNGTFSSDDIEQSRKERQDFIAGAEHQISMLSDGEYKESAEKTLLGFKKLDSILVKLEDKGIREPEIKDKEVDSSRYMIKRGVILPSGAMDKDMTNAILLLVNGKMAYDEFSDIANRKGFKVWADNYKDNPSAAISRWINNGIIDNRENPSSLREERHAPVSSKPLTLREIALREEISSLLRSAGIDVITEKESGQRVLDMANDARLNKNKKRALETASLGTSSRSLTVIPSADGAKVLKGLDTLVNKCENYATQPKTFVGDVAKALGIPIEKFKDKSSQYATFETENGKIVTIRISNHNATASNLDVNGQEDAISIVVTNKPNAGITNDGDAHIVEYYYNAIKLRKAEGKPLADIVRSIKQALYSGEFKDTTGLAERQEVNAGDMARLQKVYHGSGADFDRFDHSHMGEGEGNQSYGWGSYVTKDKTVAVMAAALHPHGTGLDRSRIEFEISRAEEALPFRTGESKKAKEKELQSLKEELSRLKPVSHIVYTVDIPDDNGQNYLPWDHALSHYQGEMIAKESEKEGYGDYELSYRDEKGDLYLNADTSSGRWLYNNELTRVLGSPRSASEFLSRAGFAGIHYDGILTGDCYVIFNDKDLKIKDKVRFFRSSGGDAYGFTTGGKIYLDPEKATAETPIHEYAHLWAEVLRRNNPEEWKNVVGLMKGCTDVWDSVRKNYPELTDDNDIADEVLATYSGRRGAERLRRMRDNILDGDGSMDDKQASVSAIDSLKQLLSRIWKDIADFLHIHYTSAEEVADRVMADLINGVNPSKVLDDAYSSAVSEGRTDDAVRILEDVAKAKGYNVTDYQGRDSWSAPVAEVAKGDFANLDKLRKTLDEYGGDSNIYGIINGIQGHDSCYYYDPGKAGFHGKDADETAAVMRSLHERNASPDTKVSIYRAVPNDVVGGDIMQGDWVALSRTYCDDLGKAKYGEGGYHIIQSEAPIKYLWQGDEDMREFGYDDGQRDVENNVPNNRKLLEITYDDNGKLIPLSKRFDMTTSDIRYQFIGENGVRTASENSEEAAKRLRLLDVAKEMDKAGKPDLAIKLATGWERGGEGKWRYEVANSVFYKPEDAAGKTFPLSRLLGGDGARELFAAYPQLEDMKVSFKESQPGCTGIFNDGEISINPSLGQKESRSVLLHELQHAIQHLEGFSTGANTDTVRYRIENIIAENQDASDYAREQVRKWADYMRAKCALDTYERLIGSDNPEMVSRAETSYWNAMDVLDNSTDSKLVNNYPEGESIEDIAKSGYHLQEAKKELARLASITHDNIKQNMDSLRTVDKLRNALNSMTDMELYARVGGEVEARNVARRMDMPMEERRESLASDTEDVARREQIFLRGDNSFSLEEPDKIETANKRFNEELDAFKNHTSKGLLHLGEPSAILKKCGIDIKELTLSPSVLHQHLKKHGLMTDDLKGLVKGLQAPMLVYKHGLNVPNIVAVTELNTPKGKLSVALRLDSYGKVVEMNNISSIHGKEVAMEIDRLYLLGEGLKKALRYVDKEKVSGWMMSSPYMETGTLGNQKLISVAKIINDFENPVIKDENLSEGSIKYDDNGARSVERADNSSVMANTEQEKARQVVSSPDRAQDLKGKETVKENRRLADTKGVAAIDRFINENGHVVPSGVSETGRKEYSMVVDFKDGHTLASTAKFYEHNNVLMNYELEGPQPLGYGPRRSVFFNIPVSMIGKEGYLDVDGKFNSIVGEMLEQIKEPTLSNTEALRDINNFLDKHGEPVPGRDAVKVDFDDNWTLERRKMNSGNKDAAGNLYLLFDENGNKANAKDIFFYDKPHPDDIVKFNSDDSIGLDIRMMRHEISRPLQKDDTLSRNMDSLARIDDFIRRNGHDVKNAAMPTREVDFADGSYMRSFHVKESPDVVHYQLIGSNSKLQFLSGEVSHAGVAPVLDKFLRQTEVPVRADMTLSDDARRMQSYENKEGRWHGAEQNELRVYGEYGKILAYFGERFDAQDTLGREDFVKGDKPVDSLMLSVWKKLNHFNSRTFLPEEKLQELGIPVNPMAKPLPLIMGKGDERHIVNMYNIESTDALTSPGDLSPEARKYLNGMMFKSEHAFDNHYDEWNKLENLVKKGDWRVPVESSPDDGKLSKFQLSAQYSYEDKKIHVMPLADEQPSYGGKRYMDVLDSLTESLYDRDNHILVKGVFADQNSLDLAHMMNAINYRIDLRDTLDDSTGYYRPVVSNPALLREDPAYAREMLTTAGKAANSIKRKTIGLDDGLDVDDNVSLDYDDDRLDLRTTTPGMGDEDGDGLSDDQENLAPSAKEDNKLKPQDREEHRHGMHR